MKRNVLCLLLGMSFATPISAADGPAETVPQWRSGVASAVITPQRRLPMAGYAARKEPAEGTEQELFAKALAIEDREGRRVVFLTMDLIGVVEELRTFVAEQVAQRYQLPPDALLMNASHTHCGPAYHRE
ncbi:MAG: neutral/alkaline non-lysosomal ceramidase N-terminal domain-containing protein, partial [Planctomycetes bacterium]|nr:neutral/alkaline non-lysosomal ceramidase N-terminal domain-containing protein [Planctomycetota bacterium]